VDGASLGLIPLADADATELQVRNTFPLRELTTDDHGVMAPESLADVDRTLLTTLTESITTLEQLDLARWRDDVRDLLAGWSGEPAMPPGTDHRAISIAARSQRVLELVDLANDDHGGSRTSREIGERASALRELSRTARAAHAAAWNTGLRDTGRRR
jgi:hypothetical protein